MPVARNHLHPNRPAKTGITQQKKADIMSAFFVLAGTPSPV
jgi:hypothetical protein